MIARDKTYSRKPFTVKSALILLAIGVGGALMAMAGWLGMQDGAAYHRGDGRLFIPGVMLVVFFLYAVVTQFINILCDTPRLTLDGRRLTIKTWRKSSTVAWTSLEPFTWNDKTRLVAPVTGQDASADLCASREVSLMAVLFADGSSLADELNNRIAAARNLDMAVIRTEMEKSVAAIKQEDDRRKIRAETGRKRGLVKIAVMLASLTLVYIATKIIVPAAPDLVRPYAKQIPLIMAAVMPAVILIANLAVNRIYPLPGKPKRRF